MIDATADTRGRTQHGARDPRELGLVDELTGLLNADALHFLGDYQARIATRTGRPFALLYVETASVGDEPAGTATGEGERRTADLLLETFRASDACARLGANEFCVLLSEVSRARIGPQIARLRLLELLERDDGAGPIRNRIELRTGVASFDPEGSESFEDVLARARADAQEMSATAAQSRAHELAVSAGDVRLLASR
jgi:diguanylate cyclase (GGDEF)-like protein